MLSLVTDTVLRALDLLETEEPEKLRVLWTEPTDTHMQFPIGVPLSANFYL